MCGKRKAVKRASLAEVPPVAPGDDLATIYLIHQNMPKKTKQIIPAKKALGADKDYQNLLDELKSIIAQGQYQATKLSIT